jgi:phospholipid-translocating ATPase
MGILDQDVSDKISIAVPQLYRRGIERKEWTQLKFWIYMIDGLYQSVICFYFPYLLFRASNFVTENGRSVNDYKRLGVYIAIPAVIVVNAYLMMNTYRWDWFMCLIAVVSSLLIFLWTGAYTSFTAGFTFYGAGAQVFGALSFWAVCLIAVILCLLPRFIGKSVQKIYFPRDVDIIREQIRQGKFDYLKDVEPTKVSLAPADKLAGSASSSEISKPTDHKAKGHENKMSEDMRPMYPPSVAPTATTHNPRSHNGSDGTDYTGHHRFSLDRQFPHINTDHTNMGGQHTFSGTNTPTTPLIAAPYDHDPESQTPVAGRPSYDRPRPSFDRLRSSMDRTRASFEASRDFTSAAYLARVESSNSANGTDAREGRNRTNRASLQVNDATYSREPSSSRMHDVSEDFR